MKKITRFGVLATLLALASFGFAQAEDPQVRKEIEAHYLKWDQAIAAKDTDTLLSMIAPNFYRRDAAGRTIDAATAKRQLAAMLTSTRSPKVHTVIHQIQTQGDEVVAWVTMHGSSAGGRRGGAGKAFSMQFAETMKKFDGEWKFVFCQELPKR